MQDLFFGFKLETAFYSKLDNTYFIQACITWAPPLEANGVITIYSYSIQNSSTIVFSGNTTNSSATVNVTVSPYASYTATVQASTIAGRGEVSAVSTVSPEAGIPYLPLQPFQS